MPRVAIIGSFRQHYSEVLEAWKTFLDNGVEVTSPKGSPIVVPGIPFVRFETDDPQLDDSTVQSVALHRILRADAVYVVAPGGYIGRTTCYEVGRVIQARRPIFFSAHPIDLPIHVSPKYILPPDAVVAELKSGPLTWLYHEGERQADDLERRLLTGPFVED